MKTVFYPLGAIFITQIITFLAGVLFVCWSSRAVVLLRGREKELNYLLDEDLKRARHIWHLIQTFTLS